MILGLVVIAGLIMIFLAVSQKSQQILPSKVIQKSGPDKMNLLDSVPETFVVFDVETTGLHAFQHEIIEIAAIKVHRDQSEHQTYTALVKPSKPIPPKITALNGITNEMVEKEGIPIENALEEFRAFIGKEKLVAFNKDFDKTFINVAAEKLGKNPIVKHVTCAYKKSRSAWPGLASYKLCDLAKMQGLSDDGTHRALADCKRTMLIYVAAAQIVKNKYRGTAYSRKKKSDGEGLISLAYEIGKGFKIGRKL